MEIPRANLYERGELDKLTLPGFKKRATLSRALGSQSHLDTVLSATVVTESVDGGLQLLTGIRRRETNATHPDVVSTPTIRIPSSFAREVISAKAHSLNIQLPSFVVNDVEPTKPVRVMYFEANPEPIPNNISMLPSLVSNLLAQKLGIGEALEQHTADNPLGTVSLKTILAGFSYASGRMEAGEEIPLFEPLLMMGAVVHLSDSSVTPSETSSYRNLGWVDANTYQLGHEMRDAGLLVPGLALTDAADVCVRGLCLSTSRAAICNPSDLRSHLGSPSLSIA